MLNITLMKFVMFEMVKAGWIWDGVVVLVADFEEKVEVLVGKKEEWLSSVMVTWWCEARDEEEEWWGGVVSARKEKVVQFKVRYLDQYLISSDTV